MLNYSEATTYFTTSYFCPDSLLKQLTSLPIQVKRQFFNYLVRGPWRDLHVLWKTCCRNHLKVTHLGLQWAQISACNLL